MDVLAFGGQKASDLVCDAYIEMVKKAPQLFGKIYKMGNKVGQFNQEKGGIRSPVYLVNKLYADALEEFIKQNEYNAVICVHIFAAEAMTNLRKHGRVGCSVRSCRQGRMLCGRGCAAPNLQGWLQTPSVVSRPGPRDSFSGCVRCGEGRSPCSARRPCGTEGPDPRGRGW